MCISGIMYLDQDHYEQVMKEKAEREKFYKKEQEDWDYYSGLPSPLAYQE